MQRDPGHKMESMERQGDVQAWQGPSKGAPEVLKGMVGAVREAGDAAHALQVVLWREEHL